MVNNAIGFLLGLMLVIQPIESFEPCVAFETIEQQHSEYNVALASHNASFRLTFNSTKTGAFVQSPTGETYALDHVTTLSDVEVMVRGYGTQHLTFTLIHPSASSCPPIEHSIEVFSIPGAVGFLPAVVTLLLTFVTRHVIFSLFVGVLTGVTIAQKYNPFFGLLTTMDTVIPSIVGSYDHAIIIIFCFMLSGMIVIVSKSGGAAGFAQLILSKAQTAKSGQLATWVLGLCVFFDDYANILIVGTTAGLVSDRFRLSAEKLAFLIDATAAPIASIAPLSSWVGFEISLIKDQLKRLHIDGDYNEYMIFLKTIPMRYYSIFLIIFCFTLVMTQRDFGPMLQCERQARRGRQEEDAEDDDEGRHETAVTSPTEALYQPLKDVPLRWYNAAVPIGSIVLIGFVGLIYDGIDQLDPDQAASIENIFSCARASHVLMWIGLTSLFIPMLMYWAQGIMSPSVTIEYFIEGMKELLEPIVVLVLAWSLGEMIGQLQLSEYLVAHLAGSLTPGFLPTSVFLLSGFIALCTGSSWSTMGVLFPIVVPLAWSVSIEDSAGLASKHDLLVQSIASILAGSVFGDHCSPISDTTILVCLATKCSIANHIRTQLPYALFVAGISICAGTIPTAFALHYTEYIAIPVGALFVILLILVAGKGVDDNSAENPVRKNVSENTLSRILMEREA